jgi:uncharacterized membrane protein YfcA
VSPGVVALLSAVVFVTSVVGVITGGNSLVNVPVMIMLGMPPRIAVATNMFAVTFMTASATARFARSGKVVTRLSVALSAIMLVTSAVGAQLTVALPERAVKATVAASMVAMLVFLIARPRFGAVAVESTPGRRAFGWAASAVLGVYGGLYSGGFTTLLTFVCVTAFGLELLESVGITKLINLVSCAAATAVFIAGGVVDYRLAAPLSVSMLLGGWVGAHLAIKQGEKFVRAVFLSMIALLAAKLLVWDLILGR